MKATTEFDAQIATVFLIMGLLRSLKLAYEIVVPMQTPIEKKI